MLGSITPLGERGRRSRWGVTAGAYAIGSIVGGAALGASAGAAGQGLLGPIGGVRSGAVRLAFLAGFVAVGVVLDLGVAGLRLPSVRRQVNEDWLHRYRGWVTGLGFGLQLGAGLATIVTTSAVYATPVAAFLSGSAVRGVIVGAAFGAARASTLFAGARVRRPEQLAALDGRIRRWDRPSHRVAIAAQVALAAGALALALG